MGFIVATDDQQSVITSTTCFQKLKVSINAKGGACWNYDRYCDHMEIDQIMIWLSLMATHSSKHMIQQQGGQIDIDESTIVDEFCKRKV